MKARQPARWKRTALNTAVSIAIASFTPMVMAASQTISDAQTTGITLTGTDAVTVTSTGSIAPTSGSTAIYVDSAATGASITNSGTIASPYESGIRVDANAAGTKIVNQDGGLISGGSSAAAIYFDGNLDGSVSNSGEVRGTGSEYAVGIYAGGDLSGTISNTSTGTISASADSSSAAAYGIRTGNISHAGTAISNSGAISVDAQAYSSSAEAYGISTGSLDGAGAAITNSGSISVTADSTSSSASAYGITTASLNGAGATIKNSGSISVGATASSSAEAYGIRGGDLNGSGATVNNSGSIIAHATSYDSEAYVHGISDGYMADNTLISNTGHIVATANADSYARASGIGAYGLGAGASITNGQEGEIEVEAISQYGYAGATGMYAGFLDGANAAVSNRGTISVDATSYGSDYETAEAYGMVAESLGSNTHVINSGSISASSYANGYADAYGISTGDLGAGASITNAASGMIDVSSVSAGGSAANATGIWFAGTMGASSSSSAPMPIGVSTSVTSSGSVISNLGTISASADAYDYSSSANPVANAAGIAGGYLGDNSRILNSGSITISAEGSDQANAYGIRVSDSGSSVLRLSTSGPGYALGAGASIANTGSISVSSTADSYASASGIATGDMGMDASIVNGKGGVIDVSALSLYDHASAMGISAGYLDGAGLSNLGTINVSSVVLSTYESGSSGYAYGFGVSTSGLTNGASILNSGTIATTVSADSYSGVSGFASGAGIVVNESIDQGASIINDTTGRLTVAVTADGITGASGISVGGLGEDASILNRKGGVIDVSASSDGYAAMAAGISAGELYGAGANIGNFGSLTVSATASGSIGSSGYAIAEGFYTDSLGDGTGLLNSGSISVSSAADSFAGASGILAGNLGADASIVNAKSGMIDVAATSQYGFADAAGVTVGDLDGSGAHVSNLGSVKAAATALGVGSHGSSTMAMAYGIRTDGLGSDTSVLNSGSVSAVADSYSGASAFAYGVATGGLSDNASLANAAGGNISATATTKSGMAEAYGVYVYDDLAGENASLTNDGSISASAYSQYPSVDDGVASATAYGIFLNGSINAGASLNIGASGSVKATAESTFGGNADATGVFVTGASGSSSGSPLVLMAPSGLAGSITNNGAIVATAKATHASEYAVANGVKLYTNTAGSFTNNGMISASAEAKSSSYARAYGVYGYGLDGTFTNSGSIVASASQADQAWSLYFEYGTGSVDNSGTLVGNLYLGDDISLNNDGAVLIPTGAMGESQAYVGGNYTQGANGILGIGATSTSQYAQLYVGGDADISAGNRLAVVVSKDNTLAKDDVLENVLRAGGTLTTDDSKAIAVIDNSLTLNFTAELNDANGIDLTAHATEFSSLAGAVGSGSGLSGAAAALEKMLNANSDNPLLQGFFGLNSSADAVNAVKKGSPTSGVGRSVLNTLHGGQHIIGARQDSLRGQASGDDFVTDKAVWFKPFGSKADQDDANGTPGYSADTYGLAIGADGELSADYRIGAAFTYAHSKVDANGVAQSATINIYQGTVYGSYNLDASTFVDYQADVGINKNEGKRSFTGATASADYDSLSTHIGASLGRMYSLNDSTVFTPSVHLDYANVSNDGYTETGAGPLNLTVDSANVDELILAVDGKVDYKVSDSAKLTANLGMGYDALADQDSLTAAFAGTPNTAFSVKGVEPSDWIARGGVGYVMTNAKSTQVSARYDVDLRDGYTNQTVSLKLMMPF